MTQELSEKRIDGSPTKELFITMLVKDITLRDAIGDLVDNSVDGAKSITEDPSKRLDSFYIEITANTNEFTIKDNCGGINADIARKYAFRFGRPEDYKPEAGIGQFGIGMKRAFFKIGNEISISSREKSSTFLININVDDWRKSSDWDFKFDNLEENIENNNVGTNINIQKLNPDVVQSFEDKKFINSLINEIALEHLISINKGLKITINGHKLKAPAVSIINDDQIKPIFLKYEYNSDLTLKILAGISEDEGGDGGWYIFCNDRLIMGMDKSSATGWTGKSGDGVAEFHDQFYRFRGYAFFYAKEVSKLPWNTTKTGMDLDSPEYKYARELMINCMKKIMPLMNKMKSEREKNNPTENRTLNNIVKQAQVVPVEEVLANEDTLNNSFYYPSEAYNPPKSNETPISYKVEKEKYNKVKKSLGASKAADVGLMTFNYYYINEVE